MANTIDFSVDFNAVYELIGAGFAFGEIGSGSEYMTNLVRCSFKYADKEFNREAAAYAKATGSIKHMYEWGTIGINSERTNMSQDAMSPQARLWKNNFEYYRGHGAIKMTFKRSIGDVPKPPARSGIKQDIIDSLQTHIFWNKAFVLEEGIPVTIKPKKDNESKLLFVPRLWKNQKGFDMYSTNTHPNISAGTRGNFTEFWEEWWNSTGQSSITTEVYENFQIDLRRAIEMMEGSVSHRGTKPLRSDNGKINRAKETVQKYLIKASRERLERAE